MSWQVSLTNSTAKLRYEILEFARVSYLYELRTPVESTTVLLEIALS